MDTSTMCTDYHNFLALIRVWEEDTMNKCTSSVGIGWKFLTSEGTPLQVEVIVPWVGYKYTAFVYKSWRPPFPSTFLFPPHMESSRLPLELIYQIIDHSSDDKDVLKSFALTASALVLYAQSYLFQKIDLDLGDCCVDKDIKALETFNEILQQSPIVGSYARTLVIGQIFKHGDFYLNSVREIVCPHHTTGSPPHVLTRASFEDWFTRKTAVISSILPFLPSVSHFVLNRHPESTIRWDEVPLPMRDAITMFLDQPSLTSLSVYFVTFTPISFFASILQQSHITTLKLEETTLMMQISTAELEGSLTSSSLKNLQTLVLITARPREYNMFYIASLILKAAVASLRHFTWFTRNSPGGRSLATHLVTYPYQPFQMLSSIPWTYPS